MSLIARWRLMREQGRYALIDGLPFRMPIASPRVQALMAVFPVNAGKAARLLPGNELHIFRLWNRALLFISVMNYLETVIGTYVEFSVGIGCAHGRRPAPRFLPLLLPTWYDLGQFVLDLPVSTEISVKGGRGIWGMPKRRANLNYVVTDTTASSQYDLDRQFCIKIEVAARRPWLPLNMSAVSFAAFRGLMTKSYVYFKGKAGISLFKSGAARLTIGDHPQVRYLKDLDIDPDPVFTAWIPQAQGLLDDHFESWFLTYDQPPDPSKPPEGLASVVNLGLSQEWLNQPFAPVPGEGLPATGA